MRKRVVIRHLRRWRRLTRNAYPNWFANEYDQFAVPPIIDDEYLIESSANDENK